ncbi:MAG: hypothetical protein HRU19_11925 [Pseudobacteriovorax sp.]|nr:hypothetical protein [Pseudobacteriovorax sp.]
MTNTLILIILLLSSNQILANRAFLTIEPVQLLTSSQATKAVFWQPCSSDLVGLFVRPEKNKRIVGVVFKHNFQRCASLPVKKSINVSHFLAKHQKPIVSVLPNQYSHRLTVLKGQSYSLQTSPNKVHSLEATYYHSCSDPIGFVLDAKLQELKTDLLAVKRKKNKTCSQDIRTARLNGVSSNFKDVSSGWTSKKQRDFTIHLNPLRIKPEKGINEPTKYQYLRRCNEAPIGLHRNLVNDRWYMAVARYSQAICPVGAIRKIWSPIDSSILNSKKDLKLGARALKMSLQLTPPVSIQKTKKTINKTEILFPKQCGKLMGPVYREHNQLVAVALASSLANTMCNSERKKLVLRSNSSAEKSLVPLVLIR